MMNDWLREAEESAKIEAKAIIDNIIDDAKEKDIKPSWYVDEVVKNINAIKQKEEMMRPIKAEELAKIEAKVIIGNIIDTANEKDIKPSWYVDEVVKNINIFKTVINIKRKEYL